jgi:DNA-binding MarR family transcriptional regulator
MIMDTSQGRTDDDVLKRDTNGLTLDDYVTFKFAILAQMFGRDASRIFSAKWGLSVPQYRIMTVLGKLPGMSLRELTDQTQMDKGQLSRVVTQMETDGLIARESDKTDGRRLVLTLTPAGARLFRQTIDTSESRQRAILSVLTPRELDELNASLAKLTTHMRARLARD